MVTVMIARQARRAFAGERFRPLGSTRRWGDARPGVRMVGINYPVPRPPALCLFADDVMAAPQPVPPVHTRHHRTEPPPRLIVADATVALIEQWKAELAVLRRRSPTSDAAKTLADCIRELADAINTGHAL